MEYQLQITAKEWKEHLEFRLRRNALASKWTMSKLDNFTKSQRVLTNFSTLKMRSAATLLKGIENNTAAFSPLIHQNRFSYTLNVIFLETHTK